MYCSLILDQVPMLLYENSFFIYDIVVTRYKPTIRFLITSPVSEKT